MGDSTAKGTSLVGVAGIRVACREHISHMVGDVVVWVRGNIVDELVDSVRSGLGGCSLLRSGGAESVKKFFVDHASVPQ